MGLIYFWHNNFRIHSKLADFLFCGYTCTFPSLKCNMLLFFTVETFCYGDVLFRRRFITGDVLLRRRFVTGDVLLRRRFVTESFCMETFCRGDVLCGDVLYVRHHDDMILLSSIITITWLWWHYIKLYNVTISREIIPLTENTPKVDYFLSKLILL
jgi:hypothetical protein